jgi:hypothetical protein
MGLGFGNWFVGTQEKKKLFYGQFLFEMLAEPESLSCLLLWLTTNVVLSRFSARFDNSYPLTLPFMAKFYTERLALSPDVSVESRRLFQRVSFFLSFFICLFIFS